ncbi:undecaprenyldiphospho-muramoylpentapeptide beta-N-acetylglucosaminyltransferase [Arenibaculum pallidiluteum]|uniref:undecaprenyldiphospho-muramoylpentapeptide beta-N-acetylglucosaminyltransferase n=1 Tax=Arenibaculum pallidiluteum TaxID=2812559 RepID=UPI001A96DF0A|nr:undecaprenyldiphospho-muramoylpentapeptide beta-N-acetylglucosaminyltransferase [Arenibaculum pallidiluteum]
MTGRPILLAAGGTGGHMFPAEALARELLAGGHAVALVTDRRGKAFGDALPEVPVLRIRAASPSGGLLGKARALVELGLGTLQAQKLLGRLRPAAVVGFGGYPSVPAVLAAQRAGIPTVLHEQNAVLGRANRLLAGGAVSICTAFPEVEAVRPADAGKLVLTGNPVRPAIAALRARPYPAPDGGVLSILVTGGSQGARIFSEVVPAALERLDAGHRARLRLAQQARPEDIEEVRRRYAALGVRAELETFFRDMPERLAACHLMVCRAGASTVAELTAAGRPALLVPYPHATDDHQTANARAAEAAGAAWLMQQPDFTPDALAARLAALLDAPGVLAAAAGAARGWGSIDAASRLAEVALAAAAGRKIETRENAA